jgi:hypothetical protein
MPGRSPIESTTHAPEALVAVAEEALLKHASAAAEARKGIGPAMDKLARWAWHGEGEAEVVRALLVETTTALYRSAADAHYGRPAIADPPSPGWLETLIATTGTDTPLGQTVIAAATRIEIMAGGSILPSTLSVLFRVDTARIRALLTKRTLEDASAGSLAAGRSGHRPKGAEIRVTGASALRWLQEMGKAPADAVVTKGRRKT